MFLKAGALSLALLLVSRLTGLLRESAQAAAFGASGLGDVAVLMLTLPDWLSGVLAGGALAYVLLPAWSHEEAGRIAATQRRVARILLGLGIVLAALLAVGHPLAIRWLAPGLTPALQPQAGRALVWSGLALPLALLAGLGVTRLQHERDFMGLYAASVVVNIVLVASLFFVARFAHGAATWVLGIGLLLAMLARLAWLYHRQAPFRRAPGLAADAATLPALPVWAWAAAAAGLPLALPFVARSLASQQGPGALAVFNYAWKLVELPLVLALQLVGTLALGPIARAVRSGERGEAAAPIRRGFALAWTLACGCVAGLLLAAPAVARLLFGWGRMQPEALVHVARWGQVGSWSLLPQAVLTIALAVLAAQERMRIAVIAYVVALAALLLGHAQDGAVLMAWLDGVWLAIAVVVLWALGPELRAWLPWRAFAASGACLLALQLALLAWGAPASLALQWALAVLAAAALVAITWCASADLRSALAR
jgi:peptidoglycan biosynthesis protein MviN/MurJ (putative lipid II flippase)